MGAELCELLLILMVARLYCKAKRIKRVLNILNLNKEQAIYVGDQTTDGEHKAGIDFAAVGWVYIG